LFFLDYVAMPSDDPTLLEAIVEGISDGCLQSDMALVGGETAILPDLYRHGDFDLAGFCVGVVERRKLIDGSNIVPGDVVLGLASTGLHSNGYSLVRKIVFDVAGLTVDDQVAACQASVRDVLMTPTAIYVRPLRSVLRHYKRKAVVHGIAHITGGGLLENLSRILPKNVAAVITKGSWPVPPVFPWLAQLGDVDEEEMYRVFNMGIGMVLVVSAHFAHSIQQQLDSLGQSNWQIGRIAAGNGQAMWTAESS
jgi:phosphoribosylformylglycinamidine cyclo-ligase